MSRALLAPSLIVLANACGGAGAVANEPPIADAGADRVIAEGASVTLDGSGSTDADGEIVACAWSQVRGPALALVDTTSPFPRFVAPEVEASAVVEIRLEVVDDDGATAYDTITITIEDATPPDAPSATLSFPVGRAEIPNDTIRVRGRASAIEGRAVASATIVHEAGSTPAVLEDDGTFRADVPLVHGDNVLVVEVTDDTGETNATAATTTVRRAHPIRVPTVMAWDETRARLLVMDEIEDGAYARKSSTLVTLDPVTGATDVVSGPTRGEGPLWARAEALVVVGDEAFVLDATEQAVISVRLESGERELLSGAESNAAAWRRGVGPFGPARRMAYDAGRHRLLFTASGPTASVVAIALAPDVGVERGDRTAIAGSGTGAGITPSSAEAIVVRDDAAYVFETDAARLVRVDLVSLARTAISALGDGKGVDFGRSGGTSSLGGFAPGPGDVLYASDVHADTLLAIDVASGVRTTVSGGSIGAGVPITGGAALVYHAEGLWLADTASGRILDVTLPSGDRTVLHASAPHHGAGEDLYVPTAVTMSPDGAHAYVTEYTGGRVFRVTLATGEVTRVTSNATEPGPALGYLQHIAYDATRGRLLVLDDALVAIDPVSGGRALVSGTSGGESVGAGPPFAYGQSFALDPTTDVAYVTDYAFTSVYLPHVYAVSLATGDRTTIYDGATTTDVPIHRPVGIAVDTARRLAFAVDDIADVITTIDLLPGSIGARTHFSSGEDPTSTDLVVLGEGPDFEYPGMLVHDTARGALYLWDDVHARLLLVSDTTGDRRILTANAQGRGIALGLDATRPELGGADDPWDMIAIAAGPTPGTIVGASNMHNGIVLIDVESGDRVRIAR